MKNFVKTKLLAEESVQGKITTARNAFAAYEAALLLNFDDLHPAESADAARKQLASAETVEAIEELRASIARFQSISQEEVAAVQRLVRIQYGPCEVAIASLKSELITLLGGYKDEAVNDENTLFASYEVPHSPTQCSAQFQSAIDEINRTVTGASSVQAAAKPSLPPARHPLFAILGVTV